MIASYRIMIMITTILGMLKQQHMAVLWGSIVPFYKGYLGTIEFGQLWEIIHCYFICSINML